MVRSRLGWHSLRNPHRYHQSSRGRWRRLGIEALTHRDDGTLRDPTIEGWDEWISASSTRNYALGDPILDWLEVYGEAQGYVRDDALPGYDLRTDFREFLFAQGREFEARVIAHLRRETDVRTIINDHLQTRSLDAAERTLAAMREGIPVFYQGVLWDAEHGAFGAPDLLVRADILERLFPGTLDAKAIAVAAPDLGGKWHYRVVDVKFSTLHLNAAGTDLTNGGSMPAYKTQLFLYNRALGRIPPTVGRDRPKSLNRLDGCGRAPLGALPTYRGCFVAGNAGALHARVVPGRRERPERPVACRETPDRARDRRTDTALAGRRREAQRRARHGHHALDGPAPHARARQHQAAEHVLRAVLRPAGHQPHDRWPSRASRPRDRSCRMALLPPLEFFADFETFGDLRDHFHTFPERGGQTLIFMIGSGHVEDGEWQFRCFVADAETEEAEARMIDAWLEHMATVRQRLAPTFEAPRVTHWSHAEKVTFETAFNSAKARHPEKGWPSPNWFDFLTQVVRKEPVVIRGAMGFGLKAVARALHSHGMLQTLWGHGPTDGLGAMMGGWWCYDEALRASVPVMSLDLMQQIVDYNEVDCKSMWEVVCAVRELK